VVSRLRAPDPDERFFTARLGSWANRHRWLTLGAVAAATVLAVAILGGLGTNTDVEGGGKGDSGQALLLLEERFGSEEGAPTELVIFEHATLGVDDSEYRETVEGLMAELRSLRAERVQTRSGTDVLSSTRVVAGTFTHYDSGAPREESPFVAVQQDAGDVSFATVALEGELDESAASSTPAAVDEIDTVIDAVSAWQERNPDFEILVGGDASQADQVTRLIDEDFGTAALLNTPLTIIIMLIAMSAVLAAVGPVAFAYLGIVLALGALAVVSQAVALDSVYIQVVLLMGLAAAIDYGLFLVSRYRIARDDGLSHEDSIVAAWNTAGKNVFIAATTTVLALCGMFFVGDPIFTGLGLAAVVTIVLALVVAMTLLPALTGPRMLRFRVPLLRRRPLAAENSPIAAVAQKVVGLAVRRPRIVAGVTAALLVAVAIPLFSLNLGFNGARALHDDIESKAAFLALEENFALGLSSPIDVVVDAGQNENVFDPDIQASISRLETAVVAANDEARAAGDRAPFGLPITTDFNAAGDTEVVHVPVNADIGEQAAIDARDLLRNSLIPAAFDGAPLERVLTSGQTAGISDFKDNINAKTPIALAFVFLASLIVLIALYRSLLVAVIAVILNALAVGAAYGILKLVFQDGRALEGVLDFEATGIVEAWLPLFVFTITFGISMDYLTFAIGRVKELHDRGMPTDQAIEQAITRGAGTVFSAALVMIAVALTFAFTRFLAIQQFGFTLAVAVLIDATLILALLLPAAMRLAGDKLWYMPSWLEWLPGGARTRREAPAATEHAPSPAAKDRPAPIV